MSTALAIDLQDYARREVAEGLSATVDAVRRRGDDAIPAAAFGPLRLTPAEIDACVGEVSLATLDDLRVVQEHVRQFAAAQRDAIADREYDGPDGIRSGVRHVAAGSVGICLPDAEDCLEAVSGAQAAVIAARVAGVRDVVACVPADCRRPDPVLVAALVLAGVDAIYRCGGPAALAALRFGSESIPRVDVTCLIGDPALEEADRTIDAIAGDREAGQGLLIIADDHADAELVAADLIAAGESGPGARGVLIATSPALGARVAGSVERQLGALPGGHRARAAWQRRGAIHLVGDGEAACALADRHGFARVEVMAVDPRWYLERLRRCSFVLLGWCAGIGLADIADGRPPASVRATAANLVGAFLAPISYREVECCVDGIAFARQRRLAGLEAHARACELRALRRSAPAGREPARAAASALG